MVVAVRVAVTVPPQPCKIATQNAFTLDASGKPVLSSPSQLTTNCTGGTSSVPVNTLFTQLALADGSYVDTINF